MPFCLWSGSSTRVTRPASVSRRNRSARMLEAIPEGLERQIDRTRRALLGQELGLHAGCNMQAVKAQRNRHLCGCVSCARERVSRTLLYSLLPMLLSGCVYMSKHTLPGACSYDLGSPIHNFCVVDRDRLWRGSRPDAGGAQWLLERGVGAIVSLQLNDQRAFEGAAPGAGFSHSVPYFQVPGFNPFQVLSRARLDTHVALFLAIMRQAPKPVYVHCRAGVDRTAIVAAAYQVLVEGIDREKVIAEMARWHSPWFRIDVQYIRDLTPERAEEIMRKTDEWQSRLRPSAQINCLHGKCAFVRNDLDPTVKSSVLK